MTAEGTFPKIKGDIFYPSEVNRMWDYVTNGTDGALAVTSGTTNINGLKRYTSISVSAGATLNLDDYATIYCSGDVDIDGSVTSDDLASAPTADWISETGGDGKGRVSAGVYSYGGGGSGGVGKYPLWLTSLGSITIGSTASLDFYGGDGTNGSSILNRVYTGTGGSGGGFFGTGGTGGDGDNLSGSLAGASAIDGLFKSNYYANKFIGLGSTGGDGGNCIEYTSSSNYCGTGGGGGSAGSHIFMKTYSDLILTTGASVSVAGADGGTGGSPGSGAGIRRGGGGGGGGGGGLIQLLYKNSYTSGGTITVTGGAGGAGGLGDDGDGDAGDAGTDGVSVIKQF